MAARIFLINATNVELHTFEADRFLLNQSTASASADILITIVTSQPVLVTPEGPEKSTEFSFFFLALRLVLPNSALLNVRAYLKR